MDEVIFGVSFDTFDLYALAIMGAFWAYLFLVLYRRLVGNKWE